MAHADASSYNYFSVGEVVDTNDPQERGRIRVYCQALGDMPGTSVSDIPWCQMVSPMSGFVNSDKFSRGASDSSTTKGAVAYGIWGSAKLGAQAVITCLNGNPMARICVGFIHPTGTTHTMPHGRFIDGDGPFSSEEEPIEPLYTNARTAFGSKTTSYEWQSRMQDNSVSKVKQGAVSAGDVISNKPDHADAGYQPARLASNVTYGSTGKNYDPQIYAWTSPGFHSISMDDSINNCRMRLRTSHGHQILLDDTNERIYICTAEGMNWIELDQDGTLDIFVSQKASIRAHNDINISSDKTIRLTGNTGIHLSAPNGEIRLSSNADMSLASTANVRISGGADTMIGATGVLNLNAGGNVLATGSEVHLNGPAAAPPGARAAFVVNRIPSHEPWARSDTTSNSSTDPKYPYDSDKIGRENKVRNKHWRR